MSETPQNPGQTPLTEEELRTTAQALEEDASRKLKAALEDVLARGRDYGLILLGACYVAGLLIVNTNLGRYGVFTVGFLKVEYVLAGALWFFLLGFCAVVLATAITRVRLAERLAAKLRKAAIAAILLLFAPTIPIDYFSDFKVNLKGDWQTTVLIEAILYGTLLGLAVWVREGHRTILWSLGIGRVMGGVRRVGAFYEPVYLSIVAAGAVSAYATFVYPELAPRFGGGRKPVVQLVLKDEGASLAPDLRATRDAQQWRTGPVQLVFQTDDALVFLPSSDAGTFKGERAVWVPKDVLVGVVFNGPLEKATLPHPLGTPTPTLPQTPTAQVKDPPR